jgi:hypothetical protein
MIFQDLATNQKCQRGLPQKAQSETNRYSHENLYN